MIAKFTFLLLATIVYSSPVAKEIDKTKKITLEKRKFFSDLDRPLIFPSNIVLYKWSKERTFDDCKDTLNSCPELCANEDVFNGKAQTLCNFSCRSGLLCNSRRAIYTAMRWYEKHTCIQFKEYNRMNIALAGHDQYVDIGTGQGCNVYPASRPRIMTLARPCFSQSTLLHELGHVIGMTHEQSRNDRHEHITVNESKIQNGVTSKYQYSPERTYNFAPYDLDSIMHYNPYMLSKGGKVFTVVDKNLEFIKQDRTTLSFYDLLSINRAYNCAGVCNRDLSRKCKNGGFLNFKCQCTCPDFFHGLGSCEVMKSDKDCGGFIELSHKERYRIKSPGYPKQYKTGKLCTWFIRGPVGSQINLKMLRFDIAENKYAASASGNCGHFVEVRYNLVAQPGPSFCGESLNGKTLTTTIHADSNTMIVILDTRRGNQTGKGFQSEVYTSVNRKKQIKCNFDFDDNDDICPLIRDRTSDRQWQSKLAGRRSYCQFKGNGGSKGYLCSISMDLSKRGERARISTVLLSASHRCVKFGYAWCGIGHITIRFVVMKIEDGKETELWVKNFDTDAHQCVEFVPVRLNVNGNRPYQIAFETVIYTFTSHIKVDDLLISTGPCMANGQLSKTD